MNKVSEVTQFFHAALQFWKISWILHVERDSGGPRCMETRPMLVVGWSMKHFVPRSGPNGKRLSPPWIIQQLDRLSNFRHETAWASRSVDGEDPDCDPQRGSTARPCQPCIDRSCAARPPAADGDPSLGARPGSLSSIRRELFFVIAVSRKKPDWAGQVVTLAGSLDAVQRHGLASLSVSGTSACWW